MKVSVVTMYGDNYSKLAEITIPIMREYCEKHGYSLYELKLEEGTKYGFKKHEYFDGLLETDIEAIFYLDVDCLITNQDILVENFMDDKHDFFVSADINEINTGVFILKNSEGGKWLNTSILQQRGKYWSEQNYINTNIATLSKNYVVKILSHPNNIQSVPYEFYYPSYGYINWKRGDEPNIKPTHEQGCWESGDFICHVPGLILNERIEILNTIKEGL